VRAQICLTDFFAATVGSPLADARKIGELHNRSLCERPLRAKNFTFLKSSF
jgi:hypothetical protein